MKLLISDFDHTLYRHPEGFLDEDVKAIKRFQKNGNKFAINTGRGYQQITQHYPEGFVQPVDFDLSVADSGTSILDKDSNVIETHPIDIDTVKKLSEKLPGVFKGFTVDGYYTIFKDTWDRPEPAVFDEIESLDDVKDKEINSISLRLDDEAAAKKTLEYINTLGLPVDGHINTNYIDVSIKGYSKAKGLQRAGEILGVAPDQIYAIGDSWNDLPALKAARKGFLITTKDPGLLKEAAENNLILVDTVAQAIEQIEKDEENA